MDNFKGQLSMEEVDQLVDEFDAHTGDAVSRHLDSVCAYEFAEVISRMIRKHEADWRMLRGFWELVRPPTKAPAMKKRTVLSAEGISVDDVLRASAENRAHLSEADRVLTKLEAEEMVWVAGWRTPWVNPASKKVDLSELATEILAVLPRLRPDEQAAVESSVALRRIGTEEKEKIAGKVLSFGRNIDVEDIAKLQQNSWRVRVHLFLEDPSSSHAANMFSTFVIWCIIAALSCVILEEVKEVNNAVPGEVWLALEIFFTFVFSVEYIGRVVTCNALGKETVTNYVLKPMNILDLIALLPLYVQAMFKYMLPEESRLLRVSRLMRLVRIFGRLSRLGHASSRISLLAPIALILSIVWGIYYKERPESSWPVSVLDPQTEEDAAKAAKRLLFGRYF